MTDKRKKTSSQIIEKKEEQLQKLLGNETMKNFCIVAINDNYICKFEHKCSNCHYLKNKDV